MLDVQWPEQSDITTSKGLLYHEGWGECLAACKRAVGEAVRKWSTLGWDKQVEARCPLLSDVSTDGLIRLKIARAAFSQYDRTRKWDQLNPEVREDWLQKVKSIMDALKEGLVIS